MKLAHAEQIRGTLRVPGDKSIAHRAILLGAIARGKQVIEGVPASADVQSTISCLKTLGTFIEEMPDGRLLVLAKNLHGGMTLDAGNSGTTARLLTGLLAGQPFETTIDGDSSLRQRPMDRVAEPLSLMGARVSASQGHLPITIDGGKLRAIDYKLPVPSAQVKSAILLAGLRAEGATVIEETIPTRDHTERLLSAMSVPVTKNDNKILIRGGAIPRATQVRIPGDISSAAYFVVAALCVDRSEVFLPTVGVNPTRIGVIEALEEMGASVELINHGSFLEEPVADLVVQSSELRGISIGRERIPSLIDELPILAVAATQAKGETVISGAEELRHKESDRIAAIVDNLRLLGANIDARDDGFVVRGPTPLVGNKVSSFGDHRIAMAMAVAGLMADGQTEIEDSAVTKVSYPTFFNDVLTVARLNL